MTMSLALEFTQEWLRSSYGWNWNQCGVRYNAEPTFSSGQFFISIEDGGVEAGPDDTETLLEKLSISVGVWRRAEHFMKDQIGMLKLPEDVYLVGSKTLYALERQVILNNKAGLHKNYDYMNALNARWRLPSADYGGSFHKPWVYVGRGPMESQVVYGSDNQEQVWYGYRLRFRGLMREQGLHLATYALG